MSLLEDLRDSISLEMLSHQERWHIVLRLYRMAQKVEDIHPLEPRHNAYCSAVVRALRAEAARLEQINNTPFSQP